MVLSQILVGFSSFGDPFPGFLFVSRFKALLSCQSMMCWVVISFPFVDL